VLPALTVLYEDNHLLVVDKPAGLLTQAARAGDDTLVERARRWLVVRHEKPGDAFVGLVQRLDRSTSGVVVLARTSKAASRLADQLRTRQGFDKRYLAIVRGRVDAPRHLEHALVEVGDGAAVAASIDLPGARLATLDLAPIATSPLASLVSVALGTGRKHQIRVQLAAVAHPLLGDRRYGGPSELAGCRAARVMLHARTTTILHPTRREPMTFEAPIPDDFSNACACLGLGP